MIDITAGAWAYLPLALIALASVAWVLERFNGRPVTDSDRQLAHKVIEASNQLAASRPKLPDPTAAKVFLPDSFVERYTALVKRGGTELQEDAMLRPHVGEWMRLEGRLMRVDKSGDTLRVMFGDDDAHPAMRLHADFHLQWSTHLAHMNPEDPIRLVAQIVDDGYSIRLRNAELL